MVQIWSWNRNRNFSKVGTGTGTVKNSYGSTTLFMSVSCTDLTVQVVLVKRNSTLACGWLI
jgi:hypothetical protein